MTNLKNLVTVLVLAGTCSIASAAVFTEDFESYASGIQQKTPSGALPKGVYGSNVWQPGDHGRERL